MMIIMMIMNVEYIWLTWLNEIQIILYCFVQIKVPPPLANDLNQLIYSSFAPHRPGDFDPCLAPPRPVPKILTLKRFINAGIVIGVENVLPKPLSWRCTNFATVLGRSHFYKKNSEFCEKLFPKPTSQMTHMFYSHSRKDLQTQDCDICGKYFMKTTL